MEAIIPFLIVLAIAWKFIDSAKKRSAKRHLILDIPNYIALDNKIAEYEGMVTQTEKQYFEQPRKQVSFNVISFRRNEAQKGCIRISEISQILCPNPKPWITQMEALASLDCQYPDSGIADKPNPYHLLELEIPEPRITFSGEWSEEARRQNFPEEYRKIESSNKMRGDLLRRIEGVNRRITNLNQKRIIYYEKQYSERESASNAYEEKCLQQANQCKNILSRYAENTKSGLENHFENVLGCLNLPEGLPRDWSSQYDPAEGIFILDFQLPNIVSCPPVKIVQLSGRSTTKELNKSEIKLLVPKIHPAILIRVAFEIFRNDPKNFIKLLCINGMVTFDDPRIGIEKKACVASLMVERSQVEGIVLEKVDPIEAFKALKGSSAHHPTDIIPIIPLLKLNTNDSRFIDAKEVLEGLSTGSNLAAMDWHDFEHLIRELFEKEFSTQGSVVKVTQSSHDRGVDAIAFDPDPIRGGKFLIQAKRYTNVVGVSAVRDLYGAVQKEGANRGILITTSHYGRDAITFKEGLPLTLLDGQELLGMLSKHGYESCRIDIAEAKRTLNLKGSKNY